jgi:hypothetical protein
MQAGLLPEGVEAPYLKTNDNRGTLKGLNTNPLEMSP